MAIAKAKPARMAWSRVDGRTLSEALTAALDELEVLRPKWERHPVEAYYVGPSGYDSAEYCTRLERVSAAILEGWKVATDKDEWMEIASTRGGSCHFDDSGGFVIPDWASVTESMTYRAVIALREAARYEAAGGTNRAWQAVAVVAFSVGAAVASASATVADIDAIVHAEIKAAFAETGRKGGIAKHAKSKKEEAKALWVAMRNKEPKPNNHLVALAIEEAKHAAYSTALKWITEWRKAKPSALT
ncbi:MAG: hypothetical protein AB7E72_06485 [Lysobacterales bacterium]